MDRFIQFEYNDKPFQPINYKKTDGILTLDTALEPVLFQFDHLDSFIKKAKQLCNHSSDDNLTVDESAAVYLYTDSRDGPNLHYVLNQALQSGNPALIEPWLGFLKLFNSALEKLPTVTDIIWRRLQIDVAEQLKENDEVVCWGITSGSASIGIIKCISDNNSVLCSIKPLNGKNIHKYSSLNGDFEVLLLPGIRLLVKGQESKNDMDEPVICLEEISNIIAEQIPSSTDVPMTSSHESGNEEDIDDNDCDKGKPTTSDNIPINESLSNNENLTETKSKAVITFANGDRYILTYKCGEKQGYGKYDSIDKENFRDQVADDKANGEGICVFENGDYFIGTFENGVRNGHGIILYQINGAIKVGIWDNDELTDQDLIISSNNIYEWKDKNNSQRWYGAYDDDNGNKYIGNINDGKAHGLGIRFWKDGSRYEGYFKNDKKHGYGIYYYTDQSKYLGEWANDEINGDGEFVWSSGTNYKGHFTNGKRHGEGKLTFGNGKVEEGKWEHDKYVS